MRITAFTDEVLLYVDEAVPVHGGDQCREVWCASAPEVVGVEHDRIAAIGVDNRWRQRADP